MASKSEADVATRSHCGDLSNPLLVLPLLSSTTNSGYNFEDKQVEADNDGELNNIIVTGYHAYEDPVLKKLRKSLGYEVRQGPGKRGVILDCYSHIQSSKRRHLS